MLFRKRKTPATATTESAPRRPKPEPLSPAVVARQLREQEEARAEAEARQESAAEIEAACSAQGVWWPGEGSSGAGRLSGRPSWGSRVVARIFGGWR